MITHEQFVKALRAQGVHIHDSQANRAMNELLPNPQSGFGVGGVEVWGDQHSIAEVRRWHHEATATVPALRGRVLASTRLLQFVQQIAANNPAANMPVQQAIALVESLGLTPRESGVMIHGEERLV